MYFKLSITAEREELERYTDAVFKNPNLYVPDAAINGMSEVILPIITMEEPSLLSFAIWGILPKNFTGDWEEIQTHTNTLNFRIETIEPNSWEGEALIARRALVPITGFYTFYDDKEELLPYLISKKSEEPFYLAGFYNQLPDGFITFSFLLGRVEGFLTNYQNLTNNIPLVISEKNKAKWIDPDLRFVDLLTLPECPKEEQFYAKPLVNERREQKLRYGPIPFFVKV